MRAKRRSGKEMLIWSEGNEFEISADYGNCIRITILHALKSLAIYYNFSFFVVTFFCTPCLKIVLEYDYKMGLIYNTKHNIHK